MNTPQSRGLGISIPKPCHEDWNKMTPNERGSFCGKCQKTVVDFSTMSTQKIQETLMAKQGEKICGRFQKKQLWESTATYPLVNKQRLKVFVAALLLVFGFGLFAPAEILAQKRTMGKVAYYPKGDVKVEYSKPDTSAVEADPLPSHEEVKMMGEPVFVEEILGKVQISKADTIIDAPPPIDVDILLQGDVEYIPMEPDTTTAIAVDTTIVMENIIMGGISIEQMDIDRPNDTAYQIIEIFETDSIINTPDPNTTEIILVEEKVPVLTQTENTDVIKNDLPELSSFPNPSGGTTTLNYTLKSLSSFRIDMTDVNGNIVKVISTQQQFYPGIYNHTIDIMEIPNGVYLIRMISENEMITTRVILQK